MIRPFKWLQSFLYYFRFFFTKSVWYLLYWQLVFTVIVVVVAIFNPITLARAPTKVGSESTSTFGSFSWSQFNVSFITFPYFLSVDKGLPSKCVLLTFRGLSFLQPHIAKTTFQGAVFYSHTRRKVHRKQSTTASLSLLVFCVVNILKNIFRGAVFC